MPVELSIPIDSLVQFYNIAMDPLSCPAPNPWNPLLACRKRTMQLVQQNKGLQAEIRQLTSTLQDTLWFMGKEREQLAMLRASIGEGSEEPTPPVEEPEPTTGETDSEGSEEWEDEEKDKPPPVPESAIPETRSQKKRRLRKEKRRQT